MFKSDLKREVLHLICKVSVFPKLSLLHPHSAPRKFKLILVLTSAGVQVLLESLGCTPPPHQTTTASITQPRLLFEMGSLSRLKKVEKGH